MTDRKSKRTTPTGRALGNIADLRPGDHLCIIYHTDEEHRAILTEYLERGLDAGERVVYIVDARTAGVIRGYLRDAGVDVAAAEERSQLVFLTRDDAYMRGGVFDPQAMLGLLREEAQRALDEGFTGLRVTGEMTWALRGLPGSERLIEYVALLSAFFPGSKATGLCQYDARRFPPDILLDVLRTHPIAVVGTKTYENPYYIPPEELLTGNADQATLNRWLATLEHSRKLNGELREQARVMSERVKELTCLRKVRQLTSQDDLSVSDLLQAVLQPIRTGWRWPEHLEVCITVDHGVYSTPGFRNSTWQQTAELVCCGETVGRLEVGYPDPPPVPTPFLDQEAELLSEIGGLLSRSIERHHHLDRLEHLNAVLKAIRNVNQLIVRERDPDRLIAETCALLTETRGFACAWIVLLNENGQPERWAGSHAKGAVEELVSMWREQGPPLCARKALNRDAPVVVEDTQSACPACPMALLYGPASGVAVCLAHEGAVYGVLTVGVPSGLAADPEESELLQEVAGDIVYALSAIRQGKAQQEAERQLAQLMANMPGMAYRCRNDREWTEEFVSDGSIDLLGYEPGALIGSRDVAYGDLIHPEDRERVWEEVQKAVTRDEPFTVNYRIRTRDGEEKWVWEQGSAVLRDTGEVVLEGFITDVTEPLHAQRALEHSLHMLRIAGEMAKLGGWYVDLAENRVLWSEEAAAIHEMPAGFSPTVDEGIAFYAPEHKERISEVFTACARDGIPYDEELQIITGSGQRVWVRTAGEPVRDPSGSIIGVQGALQDITEHKKAEDAIHRSQERFRGLFEESPVALFEEDFSAVKKEMDKLRAQGVTDLDAYFREHPEALHAWIEKIAFLSANRAAMELFGADSVEAMVAFTRDDALGPAAQAIRHEFVELYAGNMHVEHEGQARDLRGNTLETVVSLTVVAGHEERLDRVLVSIHDVTPQVRAREEVARSLEQTRAMFEGAVRSLGTLAEMRDPYTAGHQRRVAELSCAIANKMGLSERKVDDIRIAGLLHDIGKTIVPAEILNKPTTLTDLETTMIRGHPQASHDILKGLPFRSLVAAAILQHHERLDGSGYPQGLTEDAIAPEGRILAVADVVEAMASHRPYRPALGIDKALEEIQTHRGTLYDPDAVDACLELFAEGFAFAEAP